MTQKTPINVPEMAAQQEEDGIKAVMAYLEQFKERFPSRLQPQLKIVDRKDAVESEGKRVFILSADRTEENASIRAMARELSHAFGEQASVGTIYEINHAQITITGIPAQMNAAIFRRDREHYPQPRYGNEFRLNEPAGSVVKRER